MRKIVYAIIIVILILVFGRLFVDSTEAQAASLDRACGQHEVCSTVSKGSGV